MYFSWLIFVYLILKFIKICSQCTVNFDSNYGLVPKSDKTLSEPMLAYWCPYTCIIRPRWVITMKKTSKLAITVPLWKESTPAKQQMKYDVMIWKHFPHYCLFVSEINQMPGCLGDGIINAEICCVFVDGRISCWINNLVIGDWKCLNILWPAPETRIAHAAHDWSPPICLFPAWPVSTQGLFPPGYLESCSVSSLKWC